MRSYADTRGRTAVEAWVNVLRGHNASAQTSRRLRHCSCTCCPDAGRSFTRITGRSFTTPVSTPQAGQGPSRAVCSMITFTVSRSTRWTSRTLNSSSKPNNTDVASDMLVASLLDVVGDQQHVGAASPQGLRHEQAGTPLKFEEIP